MSSDHRLRNDIYIYHSPNTVKSKLIKVLSFSCSHVIYQQSNISIAIVCNLVCQLIICLFIVSCVKIKYCDLNFHIWIDTLDLLLNGFKFSLTSSHEHNIHSLFS